MKLFINSTINAPVLMKRRVSRPGQKQGQALKDIGHGFAGDEVYAEDSAAAGVALPFFVKK
ncbi:MAG: hypothetical protein J5785_02410 [Spirochaetales bacterium]|nr:hypothetical protein [Spirochaetales bacterium]